MRTLIYVDTSKPVQIGDRHRFMGWDVEVIGMQDVGARDRLLETFGNGSVTISYLQGASYKHTTFAVNIGARWVGNPN